MRITLQVNTLDKVVCTLCAPYTHTHFVETLIPLHSRVSSWVRQIRPPDTAVGTRHPECRNNITAPAAATATATACVCNRVTLWALASLDVRGIWGVNIVPCFQFNEKDLVPAIGKPLHASGPR